MSSVDSGTERATEARPTEVLVVGGGIAGLASAYALRRAGAAVPLVERSAKFGEVGAGLQLGPNATRVLQKRGLLDEVISIAVIPENLIFRDAETAFAPPSYSSAATSRTTATRTGSTPPRASSPPRGR